MEVRVRLGLGGRGGECGSERGERVLCEVGMRGRGNLGSCMLTRIGDKAVGLRLGRRCANTCRHTFESDRMALESGRVGQFASEGELLRGKVGPDAHVGSAVWAAPSG